VARLNNGSFGSCPASVLQAQVEFQRLFLAQPDFFYFNTLQPALERSRQALLPFIGLKEPDEVALVDNATTAAAIVLQHMAWQFTEGTFHKGDVVLMLHYAYGAVKKSIQAYVARAGAQVIEVPLPFPLSSPDDIIREFRTSLRIGNSNGSLFVLCSLFFFHIIILHAVGLQSYWPSTVWLPGYILQYQYHLINYFLTLFTLEFPCPSPFIPSDNCLCFMASHGSVVYSA
jgi:hypothetical protein